MIGNSSSSSTTTQYMTDPEAARRMAGVAEAAERRSDEQWQLYQDTFQPLDEAMVQANMANLGVNTDLVGAQLASQLGLVQPRTTAQELSLQESMSDIQRSAPIKDEIASQTLEGLQTARGLDSKFYKEAMDSSNVGARMAEASADVAQGFKSGNEQLMRNASRAGLNTGSRKFIDAMANQALEKSKAIGGARTSARNLAKNEGFQKLTTALNARNQTSQGQPNLTSLAINAMPVSGGALQVGNYGLTNPADRSLGYMGAAVNANAAGMRPLTQGSSSGSSWNIF